MDKLMDRQMDVQMAGIDVNYIPQWHTLYAGGIMR